MTALNIYFSTNTAEMNQPYTAIAVGTTGGTSGDQNQGYDVGVISTRAADYMELRIMQYSTGTTSTKITKREILKFLEMATKWVLLNDPSNANGLDAVIQAAITNGDATATTAGIL
jgi:hypothetical protein